MKRNVLARNAGGIFVAVSVLFSLVVSLQAEEPPCTAPPSSPAYGCPPTEGCATDFSEFAGTWSAGCWGCCGSVSAGKVVVDNATGHLEFEYNALSWGGVPAEFGAPASTFAGKTATTVRSPSVIEKTQVRNSGFENWVQVAASGGPGKLVLSGKITTTMTIEKHFDASFSSTTFSTDGPVTFLRADGKRPLRIGATYAIDALARVHPCDVKYTKIADGYLFETSIPESWLAAAAWPVLIDPLIGSPESVTEESALDDDLATAAFGGRYFIAWRSEPVGGGNDDIYGRLVAADGSVFGPTFAIATGTRQQRFPRAAYVPAGSGIIGLAHKEGDRVVLRRFDVTGALLGRTAINDLGLTDEVDELGIASDGVGNFLVAWSGWAAGSTARQIWAEIRSSTGSLVKADTLIASATGTTRLDKPEIVWNSTLGEWFFVWHQFDSAIPGSPRIPEGIAWNAGLTAATTPRFPITTTPTTNRDPDVAWNSAANEYLVVWENDPGPGVVVKGRRISPADGTLLGSEFNVEAVAGNSRNAEVSWNPVAGRWLAVFEKAISGERGTFGQALAADGTRLGTPFTLSDDAGVSEENPTLARNETDDEFLALWTDSGVASRDIWTVRLETTPPAAPAGLSTSSDADSITLTWTLGLEPDLAGYQVFRSTTAGGPHAFLAAFAAPGTGPVTWDDATALPDTTYFYVVRATDIRGNVSDASSEVSESIDTAAPAAPTGLAATPGDTTVSLTWAPNTEADLAGYNVYFRTVGSTTWILANPTLVTATTYIVTGLTNGVSYEFAVSAIDTEDNESAFSAPVVATPSDGVAPATPTGLAAAPGNRKVTLTWDPNAEPDLAGYLVYRALAPGGPYTPLTGSPISPTTYEDTGLTNGTAYFYKVSAEDTASNESGLSAFVTATPTYTAPTALTLDSTTTTSASMSWTGVSEPDLAGYNVYRATSSGGPFALLTPSPISATIFTDGGLAAGTYYWVVTAEATGGDESLHSNEITADITGASAPPAPTLFASNTRKTNDTTPVLNGTTSPGFLVKLYEGAAFLGEGTAGPTGTFAISTTAILSEAAHVIQATTQDGVGGTPSSLSSGVVVTVDVTAPAPPTGLAADVLPSYIQLNWDDNSEADLLGYNIFRKTSGPTDPWVKLNDKPLLGSEYSDTSVSPTTSYDYRVTALDDALDED